MPNFFGDFLKSLVSPISGLISEAIEDKDKANEIALKVQELVDGTAKRLDEYFQSLLKARQSIIEAEANGSWLQRNWRPMMMLWFAVLLGMYWFGATPENLSQEDRTNLFDLLKIGIGGYIVGRSAEKVAPSVIDAFKKKE